MSGSSGIPGLETCFLEPEGWRWHSFERKGRHIRFGSVFPKDSIPDAVVVCLPGLSEFCEKYFEVARTLLDKNLAFWVIDWVGQGRSSRYLKNPHKRHSDGFQEDIDDLHEWIMGYIHHSSVHPDVGRIPLALLAHSMGGHLGLRYMQQHPDTFECAAFTAPMFGLKVFENVPSPLSLALTGFLGAAAGQTYVAGGADWQEEMRPNPGHDSFSGDAMRGAVHNAWCLADPELQVGRITYGWLYQAAASCRALQKLSSFDAIQAHCLVASAGVEDFVDNSAIQKITDRLPHVKHLDFPHARHEILMETDDIRTAFFDAFYQMIQETIIDRPETLKPF